ncbi:hypothetical protein ASG85_03500 [Paenibacillus sp. Soil724D2]|nr:hypothetical protein ASG85_03500 [Paenibacillus sp. Soil724D2]
MRRSSFYFWLLTFLFISASSFYLIDLMTFRARPSGAISGNGNPAIIIILVAIPIYAVLLVMTSMFFYNVKRVTRIKKGLIIFFISLLLVFCVLGEINEVKWHLDTLNGGPNSSNSIIYRWGWFNQYTNTIFFNVNSFVFGIALSGMLGCILSIKKNRE